MHETSAEKKYIILFAILIALTGFTFESQSDNLNNAQTPSQSSQETIIDQP